MEATTWARSSAEGLLEKDLTLDIAERVRTLVTTRGFEVVMTRSADETLSLQQRAAVANGRRGDIFVSIHLNSLRPTSARGIETFYLGPSDGPEPDAIAAAENQHSGYSLADMRVMLERIYTDARRTSRGGWLNRSSARWCRRFDGPTRPSPTAASRRRPSSCWSPPTCRRFSPRCRASRTPTRRSG